MLSAIREELNHCKALFEQSTQIETPMAISNSDFFNSKCSNLNTLEDYQSLINSIDSLSTSKIQIRCTLSFKNRSILYACVGVASY